MRLKRTILIVEYSNAALIFGLFIGVFAVVSNAKGGRLLALEMLFSLPFILTFFFRKVIINYNLRKTCYPGALYSVLEKLGLTRNLEIYLSDDILDEIYRPDYSTERFMSDNHLKTEVGRKKKQFPFAWIIMVFLGFYLWKKENLPLIFKMAIIGVFVFAVTKIYLWLKGHRQQNDDNPILTFSNRTLNVDQTKLPWISIFNWSYQSASENESSAIIINYYDADRNIHDFVVDLSRFNIDKIDFLLLMTHFKGKSDKYSLQQRFTASRVRR